MEDFEIKNLGKYHNLHVRTDTVLLANTFENFRNLCLEIHKLGPARFPTASGLAWQTAYTRSNQN